LEVRTRVATLLLSSSLLSAPLLSALLWGNARDARAQTRIHVRGGARIEAHAARAAGKLVLSGTLVDDAARAIAGERVKLTIAPKGEATPIALATGAMVTACEGARGPAAQPTLDRADTVSLKTDEGGRFCVRVALARDRFVANMSFGGAGNIDAAETSVTVDLSLKPLTMRFDPVPRVLSLEGPPALFEVVATIDDEGTTTPGAELLLTLANESGTQLASGTTNTSGRARFTVPAAALGPAGRGELRVAFAGTSDTGGGTLVAPIERHAKVDLEVPAAALGKLPPGSPEDGVAIDVTAIARAGGAPPGGSVEARVGDVVVGAAPLENGKSRVLVTFATPNANETTLQLRYASDSPWYEAGNELAVTLPVRGPSPLRHVPLVVAGIAVLAWLVLGRARAPRKIADKDPASRRPIAHGEPALHVVRAAPDARGWSGCVVDAHEGRRVPNALVAIERPTFETVQTLARATTDANGEFSIPHVPAQEGDELVAEAPLHAPLRQPLPPSGELAIALVLRKRALLDRLVAWARRRGRPFDAPPEPTPGHVRRAAAGDFAVARWADAIERAAFGGGTIDAHAESEVVRLQPEARPAAPEPHDTLEDPRPPAGATDASDAAPARQDKRG